MSTSYFLYTEAYIDDKWVCINPGFDMDGKRRLAMTYESGSRSYFSQTADKIEEIGGRLRFDDLSAELQEYYESCRNDEFVRILSAEVDTMRSCMPSGQAHEYHGIVLKDAVFAYESGDVEDLYESITPEEYAKLDEVRSWSTCIGSSMIGRAFTEMGQSVNAAWLCWCSEQQCEDGTDRPGLVYEMKKGVVV